MSMMATLGLAGTGKTARLERETAESGPTDSVLASSGTIYLSPNSGTREVVRHRMGTNFDGRVHTVASFLLHGVSSYPNVEGLPPRDKDRYEFTQAESEAVRNLVVELDATARGILRSGKHLNSHGITRIVIDDFEALDPHHDDLFAILRREKGIEIKVSADPLRLMRDFKIANPLQAFRDRLESFANKLGYDGVETRWLSEDYRLSPSNHSICEMLGRNYFADRENLAKWCSESKRVKNRKPLLRFFTTANDEYEYLYRQISRIVKGTVLIVTHSKRGRNLLRDYLNERGFLLGRDLRVETVHRANSFEADNVFFVDTQFSSLSRAHPSYAVQLLYSAMSRSRSRIELLTAQPRSEALWFEELFDDEELVRVTDSQHGKLNQFARIPQIDPEAKKNDTKTKRSRSAIDSLTLRVSWKNLPFVPSTPRESTALKETLARHTRGYRMSDDLIGWNVKIHKGSYSFEFLDLNPLHRHGFDDRQIVAYLANKVIECFDGRIDLSVVMIARIDLCRYDFGSFDSRAKHFANIWKDGVVPIGTRILRVGASGGSVPMDYPELKATSSIGLKGHTLYLNTRRKKRHALTLVVYDPSEKPNANQINIEATKYEMKLVNRAVTLKSTLGDIANVEDLYRALKDNPRELIRRFNVIFEDRFGVIFDGVLGDSA